MNKAENFFNLENTNPETETVVKNSEAVENKQELSEKENHRSFSDGLSKKEIFTEVKKEISPEERRALIDDYVNRHVPEYLQELKPSLIYKLAQKLGHWRLKEILGQDNLPEREKLFIANHRGGETGKLIGALSEPVHIAAGETVNWSRSRLFVGLLKRLGMVKIKETFSNLSPEDKSLVIERARNSQKESHRQVAENDSLNNLDNIRAMVALLLRGENVALFSEGLFSRLENDPRISYAGYGLIAKEYERVSGKKLSIIPTGIGKKKVAFGEPFSVDTTGKLNRQELQTLATTKIHQLFDQVKE